MNINGIYEEFQGDNAFSTAVCNFVSSIAEDRKAAKLTEIIRSVGAPFNLSDALIDIVVAGILKACGRDKQSKDVLKYAFWAAVIALGLGIGYSIWKSQKSRKRRK
jgi:hypothetical protein